MVRTCGYKLRKLIKRSRTKQYFDINWFKKQSVRQCIHKYDIIIIIILQSARKVHKRIIFGQLVSLIYFMAFEANL